MCRNGWSSDAVDGAEASVEDQEEMILMLFEIGGVVFMCTAVSIRGAACMCASDTVRRHSSE
jgi:hypothetical protein